MKKKTKYKYMGVKTGRLTGGQNLQSIPKDSPNSGCFTQAPPWERAKTKREAWQLGSREAYENGRTEARLEGQREMEKFEMTKKQIQLDYVRVMSSTIEGMTKVLMSINGQL